MLVLDNAGVAFVLSHADQIQSVGNLCGPQVTLIVPTHPSHARRSDLWGRYPWRVSSHMVGALDFLVEFRTRTIDPVSFLFSSSLTVNGSSGWKPGNRPVACMAWTGACRSEPSSWEKLLTSS